MHHCCLVRKLNNITWRLVFCYNVLLFFCTFIYSTGQMILSIVSMLFLVSSRWLVVCVLTDLISCHTIHQGWEKQQHDDGVLDRPARKRSPPSLSEAAPRSAGGHSPRTTTTTLPPPFRSLSTSASKGRSFDTLEAIVFVDFNLSQLYVIFKCWLLVWSCISCSSILVHNIYCLVPFLFCFCCCW